MTARAVAAGPGGERRVPHRPGTGSSRCRRLARRKYADDADATQVDPADASTIALDDLLPRERVVAVDSGNFMGYPSMFLSVPDEQGFCFTQAFQSIGLGLASAIGAALAAPDRLPVAACGDGGFLMTLPESETVRRLSLGILIMVTTTTRTAQRNTTSGPAGHLLSTVVFPDTDFAAIARACGLEGLTVRRPEDLEPATRWLAGERDKSLLIDAKVVPTVVAEWLEEAFKGH